MPKKSEKLKMGGAVQIRFPDKLKTELKDIAEKTGIEFADAARLAIRFGVPLLRERMKDAVKAA